MNERKTEDMVEERLRKHGFYAPNSLITVEKQKSDSPRINKLLRHASKSGSGIGKPEFIISSDASSGFLIVIECKADSTKHKSLTRAHYADYAVDGVLLYASHLSKEFDVLAIAVSGQDQSTFRISHYLHLRGTSAAEEWTVVHDMVSFDDYYNAFVTSDIKFRQDYNALLDYSRALNNQLQFKKITEAQRGFLISGILIALKNKAFQQSYQSHRTAKQLAANLIATINSEFEDADIPAGKRELLIQSFSFIKTLPVDKEFLIEVICEIDNNINAFMKTHKYYDTIGQFYVEFLRYANNDKGLGIVLTPHHIAELFAILADVNKDSIVFDSCCGTAGLLIAAMQRMMKDAGADTIRQNAIKRNQLFGIEYQPNIYALAVCNMILHDDGKANINRDDCFELLEHVVGVKPTVGLLNPPYKNKKMRNDKEELEFVLNNMEYLDRDKGGRCVAIVPITCATNPLGAIGELKRRILEKHTLEAVMSMPIELFHNSKTTVVTCIMVFTAHRPHPLLKKTWFGYWRDDGFVKTKHRGRIDANGTWSGVRDYWVGSFINREVVDGLSVMRRVGHEEEWCAEAYLKPNYGAIDRKALFVAVKRHALSQVMIAGECAHE